MHNDNDLELIEDMKRDIYREILKISKDCNIDMYIKDPYERDYFIDELGKLCYEYRMIDSAIDNYKDKRYNEVIIDTDQFCEDGEIY